MVYAVLILSLFLSHHLQAQTKPVENLKFKVASVEVTQLACLQDRERPIGSTNWGPRKSSQFSLILLTKPSYLSEGHLSLQAYSSRSPGFFQNSSQYTSLLEMNPTKDFLILTDTVSPQNWSMALGVMASPGSMQIISIIGAHVDREKKVEYELICSF